MLYNIFKVYGYKLMNNIEGLSTPLSNNPFSSNHPSPHPISC